MRLLEEAPRAGAAVEALSDARCTIYALITSLAVGDAGETAVVVAYPRVVICVSLRTAARAEAPSSPMSLPPILQARDRMGTVREYVCQWALTEKRTLFGSRGASLLQRLQHDVALESLGQSSSSFGAEPVSLETVSMRAGWVLRAVNGR